ncbi:leucyl aminopeptidase family protein [Denitrobaculum tricleocarpae]|uniref:Leucyl aminopeptidase family protein n=1 Tax=Denitrobaculum tricleocarpae TaxID=2591009 RepID=A0A545U1C3_9PROT|nr:leucyl aminopeptidase family protein [Denitrobaculum tricleocarpae]TQV83246.1 leucyl aminopeptidase family protein [Denitrobaculum tricleocarpae]
MTKYLTSRANAETRPIHLVNQRGLKEWLTGKPVAVRRWLEASAFDAAPGRFTLLPDDKKGIGGVLVGVDETDMLWACAALPAGLPLGRYRIETDLSADDATAVALGWLLGTYRFDRYKSFESGLSSLVWPKTADQKAALGMAEGISLTRDLINTPAEDMGPAELAEAAKALAKAHKGKFKAIVGEDLLKKNFPSIHAVGRAAEKTPRLIDLKWGTKGPRVTLVGKGVCFDSGGLDLKPAGGMKMMKKDMGGSAHVLGLASIIMAAKLPVRLRVLIPAVENAVSGNAFRPLDVLDTRKGLTVEVGNTDAEGRLVLSDALTEACSEKPDLLIDFATLTGAARVALGTDLPAMFCNNDTVAAMLLRHGELEGDPVWRMPLHQPYRKQLESKVADLSNISNGPYGGAITAALFLEHFVEGATPWVHFDVMAWNLAARPGRPEGGEAMGVRATYGMIKEFVAQGGSA